ncbi:MULTISPECIES: hypothetical protein [Rhodococcus]|uniref:hypothetical protein n=1 Tax=Rhodococcus sp. IEGM 69 TaxID=3082229 RepID=UPI00398979DE
MGSADERDRPTAVAAVCRLGRAVAGAAMEGDPMFGTVEVTIEELAELLERQVPPRDQDAAPH